MTKRQRLIQALNHQEPDRVPVDFGGMRSTGIAASAYAKLVDKLGIDTRTKIYDIGQMLAVVDEEVLERFQVDVVPLEPFHASWRQRAYVDQWEPRTLFDGTPAHFPKGTRIETTPDGDWDLLNDVGEVTGRMPKNGYYFDSIESPIDFASETTIVPLEELNPPTTIPDEELEYLQTKARHLYEDTDYGILGFGFGTGFAQLSIGGWTNWLCLMATEPNYCQDVVAKAAEATIARLALVYEAVGDYPQAWGIASDDMGTQKGELLSPAMFASIVQPGYTAVCRWVHENTQWKTFIHCCGSVSRLLPGFIEAGIDIFNPVQTSAANMEPTALKQAYGRDIVFWGGGCDTQSVLPFGTPEEVYSHVQERLDIFAPGGGFVFNQVHNVQAHTPPENVIAMLDAVGDWNAGRS